MAQSITDQMEFLSEACRAVQELSASKSSRDKLRIEELHLEKEVETEKKAVADTISLTVKRRLEEVDETYDKEIAKSQDWLRRVRNKREKARNQGVKERTEEETKELRDKNRELLLQMRTVFQQDGVPGFCKSTWYYALYFPRGISELSILLLTVLICFLAVPCGIYLLLSDKSILYLIGIYFAAIIIFGGGYVLINNRTKVRHQETLKKGRKLRNQMRTNRKKIRVIANSIKRDKDEAVYNLKKYDDEIAQLEQELSDIASKKREALNTFDKVTKTIITDEISDANREKIEGMEKELGRVEREAKEAEVRVKEQTLFITDNYESFLGKEFMEPEILDQLADLVRLGKASSISEAQALYKSAKK